MTVYFVHTRSTKVVVVVVVVVVPGNVDLTCVRIELVTSTSLRFFF